LAVGRFPPHIRVGRGEERPDCREEVGGSPARLADPKGRVAMAAVVVVAVAVAAVAFAMTGNTQPLKPAADPKPPAVPAASGVTSPGAKQTQPAPTTHAKSEAPTPTRAPSSAKPGQNSTLSTAVPTPTTASPSATTRSPKPSPTTKPSRTPAVTHPPGTLSEDPAGGTAADPEQLGPGRPVGSGKAPYLAEVSNADNVTCFHTRKSKHR
jgi:cytoskeletal protein RodZ